MAVVVAGVVVAVVVSVPVAGTAAEMVMPLVVTVDTVAVVDAGATLTTVPLPVEVVAAPVEGAAVAPAVPD